jgi:sterol desaturase/sphingolipid hydroxylase (fatty acid hydroxylase superfamily)
MRLLWTWLVYPGVLLTSVWFFYRLQQQGISAGVSSYLVAVLGGVGMITVLEYLLPFRSDWRPSRTDIRVDLVFMVLVQVLLPKALVLLTAMSLVQWVGVQPAAMAGWWPHTLPDWAQMLLMMVTADFFRYWLHRAAHEWQPLWRFHAVHHSVDKLYWLNVGRFHPVDKSLQFLCDALPFILLGVSEDVLALYFVVYSIKGFFQHSNVDVKLGPLNYLISGPELHRWHHSKQVAESNQNYGNNLIIWDIVFGTFLLPWNKVVDELGLQHAYPTGFLDQIKIPFKNAEASQDVV